MKPSLVGSWGLSTFSPYFFRVRPIYDNRLHIIELNSYKETTCEIEDGKCYFIIPLYSYDDISTLVLYADTAQKNDVIFYNRVIIVIVFN